MLLRSIGATGPGNGTISVPDRCAAWLTARWTKRAGGICFMWRFHQERSFRGSSTGHGSPRFRPRAIHRRTARCPRLNFLPNLDQLGLRKAIGQRRQSEIAVAADMLSVFAHVRDSTVVKPSGRNARNCHGVFGQVSQKWTKGRGYRVVGLMSAKRFLFFARSAERAAPCGNRRSSYKNTEY